MIKYPLTCIDNFFDDPQSISKFAESLKYTPDPLNRWPGCRSETLYSINQDLFNYVCIKYLRAHHSQEEQKNLFYKADARFQIVNTEYTEGWIHTDYPIVHTMITYLSPSVDLDSGTSIYKLKDGAKTIDKSIFDIKKEYYRKVKENEKFTKKEEKHFAKIQKLNNDLFYETASFKNVFNRCIGFDGYMWHGAGKFKTNLKKDRLTLIIFFHEISSDVTGIQRCYSTPHTNFF